MESKIGDVRELTRVYGFTDTDGTRPDVWKDMADEATGLPLDLANDG